MSPLHNDWDEYLDALEFAFNNSWHQSIQTSPFKLIYGVHPKSPSEAEKLSSHTGAEVPAAKVFAEGFQTALRDAKACLAAAQIRQKQYADSKRRDVEFSIGGEVLLSTQNLNLLLKSSPTGTRKLLPKYVGPVKVQRRENAVAYELEMPDSIKFIMSSIAPCLSLTTVMAHISLLRLLSLTMSTLNTLLKGSWTTKTKCISSAKNILCIGKLLVLSIILGSQNPFLLTALTLFLSIGCKG